MAKPQSDRPTSFLVLPDRQSGQVRGIGNLLRMAGDRMAGRLAVLEHPIAPGALVPPHTHSREDEVSYVLSGTVGAQVNDELISAPPGSLILKPRGIAHAFWNVGPEPARILEIIMPAGFETFFTELDELRREGRISAERHADLGRRYGVRYHWDRIAELTERFGVRVPD